MRVSPLYKPYVILMDRLSGIFFLKFKERNGKNVAVALFP